MTTWYFSILLLLAYVGTFHLWMHIGRTGVIVSGVLIALVLSASLAFFKKRRYFLNNFDLLWHSVVVLDILLEAILVVDHNHYGFYLCAMGFAVVVGGYRLYVMRNNQHVNISSIKGNRQWNRPS